VRQAKQEKARHAQASTTGSSGGSAVAAAVATGEAAVQVFEVSDGEGEDGVVADDGVDLDAFAKLVLEGFPQALHNTELFIKVLDNFGVAEDDAARSRALHFVEALR
jgi:hypothetical protein